MKSKIPTWVFVVIVIIALLTLAVIFTYGGCTRTERSGGGHPPPTPTIETTR